eukprot:3684456-Pyramimonas_sp.AAC.1
MLTASDWSVVRIYPLTTQPTVRQRGCSTCPALASGFHHEQVARWDSSPKLGVASRCRQTARTRHDESSDRPDWSIVRIYPRFLRMIGPS